MQQPALDSLSFLLSYIVQDPLSRGWAKIFCLEDGAALKGMGLLTSINNQDSSPQAYPQVLSSKLSLN